MSGGLRVQTLLPEHLPCCLLQDLQVQIPITDLPPGMSSCTEGAPNLPTGALSRENVEGWSDGRAEKG